MSHGPYTAPALLPVPITAAAGRRDRFSPMASAWVSGHSPCNCELEVSLRFWAVESLQETRAESKAVPGLLCGPHLRQSPETEKD